MLAEIEALLIAYRDEQAKENKLVADLLTALATHSADRQKMFARVAEAADTLQARNGDQLRNGSHYGIRQEVLSDEISRALDELRNDAGARLHH